MPQFESALGRQGDSPNENADLQFLSGFCEYALGAGQKDMTAKLQKTIEFYEKAATAYEGTDQKKRAATQVNLGAAYTQLPTGDRAANLQKAITAYEAALQVRTEEDFPVDWAQTQTGLGAAYTRSWPES